MPCKSRLAIERRAAAKPVAAPALEIKVLKYYEIDQHGNKHVRKQQPSAREQTRRAFEKLRAERNPKPSYGVPMTQAGGESCTTPGWLK